MCWKQAVLKRFASFVNGTAVSIMKRFHYSLSPQTPTEVSECLVSALTLVSSPRFLGPALTTRYILPTVTVKTGNIGFKRTAFMRAFPEGTSNHLVFI